MQGYLKMSVGGSPGPDLTSSLDVYKVNRKGAPVLVILVLDTSSPSGITNWGLDVRHTMY